MAPFNHLLRHMLDWGRPTPIADDIHPRIKDDVFQWQAGSADFTSIDATTLQRADICNNPSTAASHRHLPRNRHYRCADWSTRHDEDRPAYGEQDGYD